MLSRSDFDMETIGERKTAVFMIIQDEKTTYHALATIFVKQCYESLIAVAQRHGGKLPVRTNFLLDEFANMPKFKDITTMITAARSRQIRMTMIIQNFAQLKQVYGNEDAETIRGNCGNILYLLTGELSALEEISKLCGDKIVKVGKDKKEETRPLITVTELQRFKENEVLILKHRLPPLRTKFLPFWNTDFGYGKNNAEVPPAKVTSHEQRKIKLFDIREFVKKKKEEKRNELYGGGEANPFGVSMTPNPFGGNANPFGPSPFGVQTNPNPLSAFGATSNSIPSNPLESSNNGNDNLDIDAMMKKIDARIAELEEEEKREKEAENNELKASEQKMVEEKTDVAKDSNDKTSLNNYTVDNGKLEFPSFGSKDISNFGNTNSEAKHDMFDDMIEDLSFDEPIDKNDAIKDENILKDDKSEIKAEEPINKQADDKNGEANVYRNTEEIDKIMKKKDTSKDDDDFFDEFFE